MKHTTTFAAICVAASATAANASVALTNGSGSAVPVADAIAEFEDTASLGASYSENGISFFRNGLSTNNNGCGFAGCTGNFDDFDGNYLYGVGGGGFIEISSLSNAFTGLEFILDTGFVSDPALRLEWDALLNGSSVGGGAGLVLPRGEVYGFTGAFDTLRISVFNSRTTNSTSAPAIDSVRAAFGETSAVPEPATWALMLLGFFGIGGVMRRRAQQSVSVSYS